MDICVDQIIKGDFVHGFGVVTDIKYFYRQLAVRNRTIDKEKRGFSRLDYARLVQDQQDGSYAESLDSVQIFGDGNLTKCFSPDKVVSVTRIMRKAV